MTTPKTPKEVTREMIAKAAAKNGGKLGSKRGGSSYDPRMFKDIPQKRSIQGVASGSPLCPLPTTARYQVIDDRTKRCQGIGTPDREPWKVLDTTTNKYVDEYKSVKAARQHAAQLNKETTTTTPFTWTCPHCDKTHHDVTTDDGPNVTRLLPPGPNASDRLVTLTCDFCPFTGEARVVVSVVFTRPKVGPVARETRFREHDIEFPARLQDLGFTDDSWSNDACARCSLEVGGLTIEAWCDYEDPRLREVGPERFWARIGTEKELDENGGRLFARTESETEFISAIETAIQTNGVTLPLEFSPTIR